MSANSNFKFLADRFPEVYAAIREAEQQVYAKPITAGMYTRQALELLMAWVYREDPDYEEPYRTNLAARINGDAFQRDVNPRILRGLDFIRKVGNNAVHYRRISSAEALAAVQHLHDFGGYVVRAYTTDGWPPAFVEDWVPREDKSKEALREIGSLREALAKALEEQAQLQAKLEDSEEAQSELAARQEAHKSQKEATRHLPLPQAPISESKTRELYIDLALKDAGWDLEAPDVQEYVLDNMPRNTNPSGKGAVDYLLWGENGLPLAVVEAKRTSKDARRGQQQAVVYANCLEEKFGQRPLIFYTNGFTTWLWDDTFYPPRRAHGFYEQEELQLLIDRRRSRKDLRQMEPKAEIAGRYYQQEALKRVAETLVTTGERGVLLGNRREALLVMATGTGKTRTAIALVDLLLRANWAKRVLFLADRTALVSQAKRAFNKHLPEVTAISLLDEREHGSTRLVFSTYPTMLNRIDAVNNPGGTIYGVGHFDLVIVDEAHRSIYQKYQDIFTYFDSLVIGLTATPRDETHRDTYQAFGCEQGNPTYYYELDQAVADNYLVPPRQVKLETRFLQRGIQYSELSEEEKEAFEAGFAAIGQEAPEEVTPAAINRWLFNKDTVIRILDALMTQGRHIASGDTLGKTIIFAKSQDHAEFIAEVFAEQYPRAAGHFARTISYRDGKHAETLIDQFKLSNQYPQIAISVDMLETGIDVPEIVNLVIFKPVYSKAKFWQMIGRGTRLCEDLYGPGQDKQDFYVFDCCGNFEFFDLNPDGVQTGQQRTVSEKIFMERIRLAEALREPPYIEDDKLLSYRRDLLEMSHELVADLYAQRATSFRVKLRLDTIEPFSKINKWEALQLLDLGKLETEVAPLIVIPDEDEQAKLFDVLLYRMQRLLGAGESGFSRDQQLVIDRAAALHRKAKIPAVRDHLPVIKHIQEDSFWEHAGILDLEKVRSDLRSLMRLLDRGKLDPVYLDIADEITVGEFTQPILPTAPENYLERVAAFVREHQDYMVIRKLRGNEAITTAELQQLEQLLFDGDERGTKADLQVALGTEQPLGLFIRSILGLERRAALDAFADFLQEGHFNSNQQKFVEMIIDHFTNEGVIDPAQLYDSPYTSLHLEGLDGIFSDEDCSMIVSIVRRVNENAVG